MIRMLDATETLTASHVPNVTTWSPWLASPPRRSNTQPSMPSAYAGDIAGYRTFILDIPPSREELGHVKTAFQHAGATA